MGNCYGNGLLVGMRNGDRDLLDTSLLGSSSGFAVELLENG